MTKIIQRHDTAANWTSINPVLAAGEMGVETDTNKFKFGDGVTAWAGLAYAAGEGGGGDSYTKAETDDLLSTKSDKILNMADFYKIGTPTISGSTYTSSSNNYLACNISSLNMSQPYEIGICLNVTGSISGYSTGISILGTNNGLDYQGLKIALNEAGYIVPYLSTNGTSWNYNSSASSLRLNSAGTYYIKFEKQAGSYYMYYSTDKGSTWITAYSKTGYTGALLNSGYFVIGGNNGDYLRNSSFDISKFYIKQGSNYIISGILNSTKPVPKATTSSLGVVQPDGTSITVSDAGVISAVGGDVTAAGNNTFTGSNTFNKKIKIPLATTDHENGIEMTSSLFLGDANQNTLNPVFIARKTSIGSQIARLVLSASGRCGIDVGNGTTQSALSVIAGLYVSDTGLYYVSGGVEKNIIELIESLSARVTALENKTT